MFRDDLGAANARIAALEAKIAELERERDRMPAKAEQRIAELERQLEQARGKAERAEQAAKAKGKDKVDDQDATRPRDVPAARPPGPRQRPGTWAVAKTIGVAALVLGALVLYLWYSLRITLSAGEVRAAHWLQGEAGPELLLVIEASRKRGDNSATMARRLELRDGRTGQRSARIDIGRDYRLVGITPGGLWFAAEADNRSTGGLHRRDRHTLAVTLTEAAWRAKSPALGRVVYLGGVLHEDAAAFPLRSDDGRYHYLDPETLQTREAPALERRQRTGALRSTTDEEPMSRAVLPDGTPVRFTDAERAALRCGGVASTETVLLPRLLHLGDGERVTPAHAGAGGDSLLVVHRISLSSRKLQLSLLPCQGPARWTRDLPGEVDGSAWLDLPAGELRVLARKGRGHVLMAIALDDGAVRWQQAL